MRSSKPPVRRTKPDPKRLQSITLEPRILLSADVGLGAGGDSLDDDKQQTQDNNRPAELAALAQYNRQANALHQLPEPLNLEAVDTLLANTPLTFDSVFEFADVSQSEANRLEIIFVDTSTADYEMFIEDIESSGTTGVTYQVVLIDADENGLENINSTLEAMGGADAIHIVSHGEDGGVKLGNVWLTSDNLSNYTDLLSDWDLNANADVLIYGCNLALTENGTLLIQGIAQLTGADIAASDDLTGAAQFEGDWDLEYQTGVIESQNPFSETLQVAWTHVLAPPTTAGIADVTVTQGAADTIVNLLPAFSDVEDNDADLVYTIESNTNPGLFDATTIDLAGDTLTLDYNDGAYGTADITIKATDSDSDTVTTTFTVTVNPDSTLLISTEGAGGAATHGLASWTANEILEFGGTDLALGPATDGDFLSVLDVGANIDALHYVTTNLTLGNTNTIAVQPGDLLISVASNSTLVSTSDTPEADLAATAADIILIRPDTPGDYSKVNYFMVLDNVPGGVEALSLVEEDTIVGNVLVQAGELLIGSGNSVDVYQPDDLSNAASGTSFTLVDGADLRDDSGDPMILRFISGIELIENTMTVGGVTLNSGTLLLTISQNAPGTIDVLGEDGTNPDTTLAVSEFDVFAAEFTNSSIGDTPLAGTATMLFEGGDVELTDRPNLEDLDALALYTEVPEGIANNTPTTVADNYSLDIGETLTLTDPSTFVVANDTDPDGDTLIAGLVSGPANAASFTLNQDGSFVYEHDGVATGTDTFTYAVGDGKGGVGGTVTVTLFIGPSVNDPPTATNLTSTTVYNEGDASVDITDIVVSDIDIVPAQTITATLTLSDVTTGSLTTSGTATYDSVTGIWTITDTVANVNAALANVSFTPNADNDKDVTITTHIEDQDGAGPADGLITLDATPANDAPTASDMTSTSNYTEGDGTVALTDIVVSEIDTDPAQIITATLTLDDTTTGVLTTSGSATYDPGTGIWTITDTVANVNTALQNVSFTPNTDNDKDTFITTHIEDQDGTGPADGVITLGVTPENDAPTATDMTSVSAYTEGDGTVAITDIVVSEVDTDPAQTITATLTLDDTTTGVLTTSGSATYDPGTGIWTITDTVANVNTALQNVSFTPNVDNDKDTFITTHIEDQDGVGPADGTISLNVTPANDAPTASNMTSVSAYNEGDGTVAITDIVVSDIDTDPTQTITATLTLDDPTTGVLTTSGAATYDPGTGIWTITDTVANVNTALQNVSFTPNADNDKDTFITTQIEDQDGVGPADGTISLDVTPANDAPTATNLTSVSAYNEGDGTVAITDIVVSDDDTDPAQTITATLTLSDVTTGVLTTSGAATYDPLTGIWTITDTVANVNTALANVSFTPYTDNDKDATITTHIEDQDGAGPADGTITLDVTPANDAPTASNLTSTSFYSTGDLSVPITDIVVSEVDTDPAQIITATLTLSNTATGALTTSGSATYDPITGIWTITDTIANVNAALANVTFAPLVANVLDATITTVIQDQDGAGPAAGTIFLDVNGANSPPTTADNTVVVAEDMGTALAVGDFPFTDPDAGTLAGITVTSLPAAGSLTLSGVPVTAGQFITSADITAGNLVYTPVANEDGTGVADFDFTVNDGALDSTASATLTIDINPDNDPPSATNLTSVSVYNEGDGTVAITDIVVSEVDTNPAQTITATLTLSDVTTGVLTTSGTATYDAVTGIWTITDTVANVNSALANVSFTPNADNDKDATITTHIEDQDGVGPADGTISLNVTPANDAPTATNLTSVSAYNEGDGTVAITDIVVSDVDTDPAQTITATLTLSDVTTGVLTTSGSATYDAVTGIWTITDTLANVNTALSNVSFTPNADNDKDATITTHIEDQNGAGPADGTISLNVTPGNDAPTATNLTSVSAYNEGDGTVAITDIVVSDTDTDPTQTITATLTLSDVTTGVLTTSGTATYDPVTGIWTITDTIANVNTALANISFTPNADNDKDATITTHIEDQDGAGPADGSISLNVMPANDAPTATNLSSISSYNPGDPTVAITDIVVSDGDTDPTQTITATLTLSNVATGTLSTSGTATYDAVTGIWTITDTIANVNTALANVAFIPAPLNTLDATITTVIQDQNGAGPAAGTISLDVIGTNSAPTTSDNTLTLTEDIAQTLNTADFNFADSDAGDVLAGITINALPASGSLTLSGGAVTAGQFVTAADIAAGNLVYTPAANANGLGAADFDFTVNDGTTDSTTSATMTFDITAVNDNPTGTVTVSGTLEEGETLTADTSSISDNDGVGPFNVQWLRDGNPIAGETGANYTLTNDDVGAVIQVRVNYLDGGGTTETITSVAGAPVTNINDAVQGDVLVTGTTTEGETLTADASGLTDDDGIGTFSYQWLRNGTPITGATDPTYTLTADDADQIVAVTVSFTDDNGTDEAVTSADAGPIVGLNVAPDTTGIADLTVDEDSGVHIVDAGPSFTDADGDDLTYALTSITDPSLFLTITIDADGVITLTTADDASGTTDIEVTATDPDGETVSTIFSATVLPLNDLPEAFSDSVNGSENTVLISTSVIANDSEGDTGPLTVTELSSGGTTVVPGQPIGGTNGGTFTVNADGTFSFDPGTDFESLSAGQTAPSSVVYTVEDADGNPAQATLTVTVVGQNDPVTAVSDNLVTQADSPLTAGGLLANDSDPDAGDTLRITSLSNGTTSVAPGSSIAGTSGGTFVVGANGSLSFDPGLDFVNLPEGVSSTTSVTYEVTDGQGSVSTATVTVTVNGIPSSTPSTPTPVTPTPTTPTTPVNDTTTDPITTTDDTTSDTTDSPTDTQTPVEEPTEEAATNTEETAEEAESEEQGQSGSGEASFDVDVDVDIDAEGGTNDVTQRLDGLSISAQLSAIVPSFNEVDIDPVSGLDVLSLRGIDARQSAGLIGSTDALILISSPDYSRSLDESREQAEESQADSQNVKGGTLTISAGLSIGYVIYLIRSGVIMSSVLTALPAWRLIDPLPVLGSFDAAEDDGESIEDIVQSSDNTSEEAEVEGDDQSSTEDAPTSEERDKPNV